MESVIEVLSYVGTIVGFVVVAVALAAVSVAALLK